MEQQVRSFTRRLHRRGSQSAPTAGPGAWVARVCLAIGLTLAAAGQARAGSFSDLEVRAVYLYNFAAFVDWPSTAFASPTSPIRYCVLASRGLYDSLEQALAGEKVAGRALELVAADAPETWPDCHLLYVDLGFQARTGAVLNATRGKPVLTVGDSEAFAQRGGMIGLVRSGGRLRTFINREALASVGIRVSSKLLRLSTLVSEGAEQSPP